MLDNETKINNNKIEKFGILKTNHQSQELNIFSFKYNRGRLCSH